MKKTTLSLGAVFAAIAAAVLATRSPHREPTTAQIAAWQRVCRSVWQEELRRDIDPGGLDSCVLQQRRGAGADDVRATVRTSDEWRHLQEPPAVPDPPQVVRLGPLTTRGPVFLQGTTPWRWKGVSAFQLLDRFIHGEDITPFLDAYQGFNVLRVWPYVPRKDWGDRAWETPTVGEILPFLWAVEARGFYVELTLLTDDDPARLARAKTLIAQLAEQHPTNLLLEAGNEPQTHKAIDTAALIPALQASGFPWTTGDYEDSARMKGTYGVTHTARDGEWPRRAHDVLEFFHGGGPNTPDDPPHHVPIIADEPAKRQDVGGNRPLDWRAYFAAVSLLGGGGTFHSETGKFGQVPTPEEAQLAREALTGLDAFPADAPLGLYSRPVEASLRTYIVSDHMVRIRPTRPPPAGWTCDADGIVCHR